MITKNDKKIISLLSRDIPLNEEPFKILAEKLGIRQKVLIDKIKSYRGKGFLRKFSAALNHKKIGFRYNAMVVWNVPEPDIDKSGSLMASFRQVSHCYQRKKRPDWNYNLYSMIHGRTKKECLEVIRSISEGIVFTEYKILFSSQEYKKASPEY